MRIQPDQVEAQLAVALPAVAAACRLTRQVQGQVESLEKADGSPVTLADFCAQALLMRTLGAAFPEDDFIAEESADALRADPALLERLVALLRQEDSQASGQAVCEWIEAGRRASGADRWWLIDPLDGTKGFLSGGQYAIALALVVEGRVAGGLLGCPNIGPDGSPWIFGATAEGAWGHPLAGARRPLRVSSLTDLSQARPLESRVSAHSDLGRQERIYLQAGLSSESVRLDSQAKYAMVATARGEVYLRLPNPAYPDYIEKSWDHAAGALLVSAAGGRVTDMHGATLDFAEGPLMSRTQGVLATAGGPLHDAMLEAIAAVGP